MKENQPTFEDVVSLENLLSAWSEFTNGKKGRKDVQEFEHHLMKHIIRLHHDLIGKIYTHSPYEATKTFKRFEYKVSQNHTRTAWVLKCDVRKFFASIDQKVLIEILESYISDKNIIWILKKIIGSFYSTREGIGLPLGNLTSQLLVNIYMNEFDQFVKHRIKAKYYIRYADDFVILSEDKKELEDMLPRITDFLLRRLKLHLHPNKISITTVASGVDFLGWVHFPDHRVLRTVTKRRMFRNIKIKNGKPETLRSYLGLLKHGNTKVLRTKL